MKGYKFFFRVLKLCRYFGNGIRLFMVLQVSVDYIEWKDLDFLGQ